MSLLEFLKNLFGLNKSQTTSSSSQETKKSEEKNMSTSSNGSYLINVGTMPASLSAIQSASWFSKKDFASVAAAALCAFDLYATNKDEALAILDFLKGPSPLSAYDKQFLKDRLIDKKYLAKSYFEGATPANNYTPASPLKVAFKENAYSRNEFSSGYIVLFVQSGGADSLRPVKLRTKPSTGEWFLWEYGGLLSGIRVPAAQDDWA